MSDSVVLGPPARQRAVWPVRYQRRRVSAVQPIFPAIEVIADHSEG
jgi:hypothetical protein